MAAGAGVAMLTRPRATPVPSLELSLLPPPNAAFTTFYSAGTPKFALSPDGTRIVIVVSRPARPPALWIRTLDSSVAQELPGTEGAFDPFWSPDSQSIGFFADGKLKRTGLRDSRPQVLADVTGVLDGGGAWSPTDVILFADTRGAFSRVRASGGPIEPMTSPSVEDITSQRWPQFLPDGHHFIYSGASGATYLGDLNASQVAKLFESAGTALYAAPGFLLFPRAGRLMAQAIDPTSLKVVGEPAAIIDQIGYAGGARQPPVSASATGLLAYWDGQVIATELRWFDRSGTPLPSNRTLTTALGATFAVSPDGRQIAFTREGDIWLVGPDGAMSRFGFTPRASWPLWSADGHSLLFRTASGALVRRAVSGAEKTQTLANYPTEYYPTDWSGDGRLLMLVTRTAAGWHVDTMLTDSGKRTMLLRTRANEIQARLSPDGRWLAYSSDESGRWEVYVQPFPLTGAKWQISVDGGSQPVWQRDGRELFFLGADSRLMAVRIDTTGSFSASAPQALFQARMRTTTEPFQTDYATVDGQRFLIKSMIEGSGVTVSVLSDWTARIVAVRQRRRQEQ
jgi:Tol biopolymer transport system component